MSLYISSLSYILRISTECRTISTPSLLRVATWYATLHVGMTISFMLGTRVGFIGFHPQPLVSAPSYLLLLDSVRLAQD